MSLTLNNSAKPRLLQIFYKISLLSKRFVFKSVVFKSYVFKSCVSLFLVSLTFVSLHSATAATLESQHGKNESQANSQLANTKLARHDFPYPSHYANVLGSKMHYVDTGGKGSTILMLHGQPTWSYLWRNVIPELEDKHRVIALDLIGFGKSDKPDINYTVEEHAKFLRGFIDSLNLEDITLVIHDWGSFLGFDYAAEFPHKVKAIAFMESILPFGEPEPEGSANRKIMDNFIGLVQQFRTPGVGENMILEDNFFIEKLLLSSPSFTEDEKNAYREPFARGKNRIPMLQFPRQISFDGIEPAYVVAGFKRYKKYLMQTEIPKLLLTFTPGALIGPKKVEWAQEHLPNLQVKHIGKGVHFVQEDHPKAIGSEIQQWMQTFDL